MREKNYRIIDNSGKQFKGNLDRKASRRDWITRGGRIQEAVRTETTTVQNEKTLAHLADTMTQTSREIQLYRGCQQLVEGQGRFMSVTPYLECAKTFGNVYQLRIGTGVHITYVSDLKLAMFCDEDYTIAEDEFLIGGNCKLVRKENSYIVVPF